MDQLTNQLINQYVYVNYNGIFIECTCLESPYINEIKITLRIHDQSIVNYHNSCYTYYFCGKDNITIVPIPSQYQEHIQYLYHVK